MCVCIHINWLFSGDPSAFSQWEFANQYYLSFLMVSFSFIIVVYLLNLFIRYYNVRLDEIIKIIRSIDNDYKNEEDAPFISDELRGIVSALPKKNERKDFTKDFEKLQSNLTQKVENQLNQNNQLIMDQLQ